MAVEPSQQDKMSLVLSDLSLLGTNGGGGVGGVTSVITINRGSETKIVLTISGLVQILVLSEQVASLQRRKAAGSLSCGV